jgi:hypothetical protein
MHSFTLTGNNNTVALFKHICIHAAPSIRICLSVCMTTQELLNRSPWNFSVENFTKDYWAISIFSYIRQFQWTLYKHFCTHLEQKMFQTKPGEKSNTHFTFSTPFLYVLWFQTSYNKGVAMLTFPNLYIQQSIMVFQTYVKITKVSHCWW